MPQVVDNADATVVDWHLEVGNRPMRVNSCRDPTEASITPCHDSSIFGPNSRRMMPRLCFGLA